MAITSFSLMMCFFALAAITIELDRRHSIANSRSPLYVESEDDASFAYRVDNTFIGGKLVGVLELEPVRDDEVPPPGLTEWIEPGSIAVSSSAQKHADVLERQFGPIQAVIDDAVVLEGEHVVYYRPSNGAADVA